MLSCMTKTVSFKQHCTMACRWATILVHMLLATSIPVTTGKWAITCSWHMLQL